MNEQDLSDRLHAVEVPPSRVLVESVLTAGRRRAVRRRGAQVTGAVVLAGGVLLAVPLIVPRAGVAPPVTPVAPASPVAVSKAAPRMSAANAAKNVTCRPAALKAPAGIKGITIAGVDPTGRYIIGNGLVGQNFRPVLWTDGVPKALPVIAQSVQTTDVNSAGTVVGESSSGANTWLFKYENGTYTKLRLPAGNWNPYPVPTINSTGDVLINIEPRNNSGGKGSKVLMWKAGSTTPVVLPLPTGANGLGLKDDGTIVGALYKDGTAVGAYLWTQQGHATRLATPAGKTSAAYGVRGDWAVGGLWDPGTAALWNLRTGKVVALVGQPATKVNSQGWAVVDAAVARGDGIVTELPLPGDKEGSAEAISDTGLVIGHGDDGLHTWQC